MRLIPQIIFSCIVYQCGNLLFLAITSMTHQSSNLVFGKFKCKIDLCFFVVLTK